MRFTLIALEVVILFPALVLLLDLLHPKQSTTTRRIHLLVHLLMPPLLYIDHVHFQPNSAMHGLVLWATYFILKGNVELAVVAMVLAVNFKQMALYFGMPFAFYALSLLWQSARSKY